MQVRNHLTAHQKPIWETGKYYNRLYNDNNMTQLRVEHDLGNDWKLNAGVQYLNGKLHGYAVEANGIQNDGETLGAKLQLSRIKMARYRCPN